VGEQPSHDGKSTPQVVTHDGAPVWSTISQRSLSYGCRPLRERVA